MEGCLQQVQNVGSFTVTSYAEFANAHTRCTTRHSVNLVTEVVILNNTLIVSYIILLMRNFQIQELLLHMRRIGGEVTKAIEDEMEDTSNWIHELDVALEEVLNPGVWKYMYM